jgi:hypothetical protein
MAARRSNLLRATVDETSELRRRVTELEARVRWLERKLKKVAQAARVKPDPSPKGPQRPRCPSCFGEVPKGQRSKTCIYCGFSFDVVAPIRPRRPR